MGRHLRRLASTRPVRSWLSILTMAILAVQASPAAGQMAGCNMGSTAGYKVLLSDVSVSGQPSGPPVLGDDLYFLIKGKLDALGAAGLGAQAQIVRCPGRQPNISGQDYSAPVVRQLNTYNVLFDMWGSVAATPSGGQQQEILWVAYYLVPIGYYDAQGPINPLQHTDLQQAVQAVDPANDFRGMLDRGAGFEVYASIMLGFKFVKNDHYDDARRAFCIAQLRLKQALPANGPASPELMALSDYIKVQLKANTDLAQHDKNYAGSLKQLAGLLGDADACAGL
jgi:hypothetical protein